MKKTGEIDIKLGQAIVRYRMVAGLNRKELAQKIGVTHQQLQKYERGLNRICVARLFDIAKTLNIPVTKLLSEVESVSVNTTDKDNRSLSDIMRHINNIEDSTKLDAIKNLVKSISVDEIRSAS